MQRPSTVSHICDFLGATADNRMDDHFGQLHLENFNGVGLPPSRFEVNELSKPFDRATSTCRLDTSASFLAEFRRTSDAHDQTPEGTVDKWGDSSGGRRYVWAHVSIEGAFVSPTIDSTVTKPASVPRRWQRSEFGSNVCTRIFDCVLAHAYLSILFVSRSSWSFVR